jgi:anaerobic sulfite reductase subunit B
MTGGNLLLDRNEEETKPQSAERTVVMATGTAIEMTTTVGERVIAGPVPESPMRPARYIVAARCPETSDTVTLMLRPVDHPIQAPHPGQFTMLYAFGVGAVPVSVSGFRGSAGPLVHTIRAVGATTRALCAAMPGDMVGVRGPFGTDWGMSGADGRDMLIVAGGIGLAPLRPVVLTALARRARYDRVVLLVGARSPQDLIFARELEIWRKRGADVRVTVERGDAGWDGHVGLITALIEDAVADPAGTAAFVCGPEIMMRRAAEALVNCGVPAADIRVSLERNMRCGTALCGHCQLGPLLLCRDGQVVSYADAAPQRP